MTDRYASFANSGARPGRGQAARPARPAAAAPAPPGRPARRPARCWSARRPAAGWPSRSARSLDAAGVERRAATRRRRRATPRWSSTPPASPTPTGLRELYDFFHPHGPRRCSPSGRVIVLGTPPEPCGTTRARRPRSARWRASSAASARSSAAARPPSWSTSRPAREDARRVDAAVPALRPVGVRLRAGHPGRRRPTVDRAGRLGAPAGRQGRPGHRRGPRASARRSPGCWPATARTWSRSTCRPPATRSPRSPTTSAVRRCSST